MLKTIWKMLTTPKATPDPKLEKLRAKYVGLKFFDNGTKTATRTIIDVNRSKFDANDFYLTIDATNTGKRYHITLSKFDLKDHVIDKSIESHARV